jgi:hypothetical protein
MPSVYIDYSRNPIAAQFKYSYQYSSSRRFISEKNGEAGV